MKSLLLALLCITLQAKPSLGARSSSTGNNPSLRRATKGNNPKGVPKNTGGTATTTDNSTETTYYSTVGTAVCAAITTKTTDQLAFTAYFNTGGAHAAGDNFLAIKTVSKAMEASMMDVLNRETFAPLDIGIEHSLGFQVQNITFDDEPIMAMENGTFSIAFTNTTFDMFLSFECCVGDTIEGDIFDLVVSLLAGEKDNLAGLFAQHVSDTTFDRVEWGTPVQAIDNGGLIGGADEHGCIAGAGSSWCDTLSKCTWWYEPSCPSSVGEDYGCDAASGTYWCTSTKECVQPSSENPWANACPELIF